MKYFQKGQSLIELLVTIGLFAILLPALFSGFAAARGGRSQQDQRQLAIQLVREGQEAVRVVREANWKNLITGTYYPCKSGTTWALCTGADPGVPSGFNRSISISSVSRDLLTGNIVTSGGVNDPSTVKVITIVSWTNPSSSSVSQTEYLTRYKNDTSFTDTSTSDFNKPSAIFSSTQAVDPGRITLQYSPAGADWCSPGTPIAFTNLGGNGLAGSVVAGVNRAFVGTGKNASSHPFYNVKIDYSGATPNPSVPVNGYYDSSGLKANDVFGETTYAYLATPHNGGRWVVILNVSSDQPTLLSTISSQNNNDASSIFVASPTLYFTAGNTLYVYDVSTRSAPVAKGTFTLSSSANKIYVVGGYLYAALTSTTNQFQIVDVSDPTHPKNPGGGGAILKSMGNSQPGMSLFVLSDGSRAYLITSRSASKSDFFIINTTNKTAPSIIGSGFSTGAMDPKGITVIDNRAIIVGFTNPRYQVLNVTSDAYTWCNPTSANEPDDIYNVSSQYVNGHAYSYITTSNTSSAFEMIEGGPGNAAAYATSGTYESGTSWTSLSLPSTNKIAFNNFQVTYIKPTNTDIQFQIAVGDVDGSGNCTSFSYVGSGQPPTVGFFTTPNVYSNSPVTKIYTIPFGTNVSGYGNPGKCFRYKVYLYDTNGNTTTTPELDDITVNYSP